LIARTSHRFATYRGDTTDVVGQVVGPNLMGERMTAVSASYDAGTNRTRVGFDFARAEDVTR
jgi:hypothetical protein